MMSLPGKSACSLLTRSGIGRYGEPQDIAELMAFLKSAQDPRAEMFSGQIRDMTIGGEETRIVLSRISRRYYLLLLLGGEGILGQGRYELARYELALRRMQRGAAVRAVPRGA